MPDWTSLLPPLVAILVALVYKKVLPALFVGLWVGVWVRAGFSLAGVWHSLLGTVTDYVVPVMADPGNAAIIVFSFMIGGMVGLVTRNGGMQGIVAGITRWATTPRHGQMAAALLGLIIFFDDYANCLVVGNTLRPVADRLRLSRAKLAYLVDTTAAPVASTALVTTWIGYQVGLLDGALAQTGAATSAYALFLASLVYSFYPFLALAFMLLVAVTGRDFGPMAAAEQQTRQGRAVESATPFATAELSPRPGVPARAVNALVPLVVLVVAVLAGLYVTGEGTSLRQIIGSADANKALLWGSLLSVLVALLLSVGQRLLTVDEAVAAWLEGVVSMMYGMVILVLAWALARIAADLKTAEYLTSLLAGAIPAPLLPTLVFILSAATSFAIGTSWGTMGLLMPLVLPLAWATQPDLDLLAMNAAAVLTGAVWGDHASPIASTTVLAAVNTGCDLVDHVRTQLPYALFVGAVALLCGTLPAGYGLPGWVGLLFGLLMAGAGLRVFGKKTISAPEKTALARLN
jgi:Na+/H+ antiporter NhaC